MNWPAIFLGCFVVGFLSSAVSFAFSAVHLHFHVHLPFLHHAHVHGPMARSGHVGHPSARGSGVSPVNFATTMAFLAWFGGTGYLLTTEFGWLAVPALVGSTLVGLGGGGVVFLVMARVLWSPDENMTSADSAVVGALGRISQSIREGGTGELIYSRSGSRHSCGARSADGQPIGKGVEVVVTAYDRGIAYVRRWDDLAANKF